MSADIVDFKLKVKLANSRLGRERSTLRHKSTPNAFAENSST